MQIDREKLRRVATALQERIDDPDYHAAFSDALHDYRVETEPSVVLALLDALDAADVKNTLLSACLHKAEGERDKFRTVLDGLPQDAIDGGWTARGMSAYATNLEGRRNELLAENAALLEDKARLDSGCILFRTYDSMGYDCVTESRGNDLRSMIDQAMELRNHDAARKE